jgi:uncharacterized protein (TIGR04255 family)
MALRNHPVTETFQNAPLVEIVAELRWAIPQPTDPSGNTLQLPIPLALPDNEMTAFFHRITAALDKHGFNRLEQLTAPGVPVLLPQMVYRYRRGDETPVLAQVGPGMFSVNALSPYKSWVQFRPLLEGGINGLLEVLAGKPELTASLRYIDAYKQDLAGGRDARAFATEVMGFRLDLPATLQERLPAGRQAAVSFQMRLPLPEMAMTITVSDGNLGTAPAVLMNTDIRIEKPLAAETQAILAALDEAHELTHSVFVNLTRSIREKMQPIPAGETA